MDVSAKELFKAVGHNLLQNKWLFLSQGALLQLVLLLLGTALVQFGFRLILVISGQPNLSLDTFKAILFDPLGLAGVLIFVTIVAFLLFFEYAILTFLVAGSYQNQKLTWKNICILTAKRIRKLNWKQIPFFLLYFLSMVPAANLDMGSFLTDRLYIPHFITGELMKTTTGLWGMMILWLVLIYVNFRLLFTLPLTMVNEQSIVANIRKSWAMTKKGKHTFVFSWLALESILAILTICMLLFFLFLGGVLDTSGQSIVVETVLFTIFKTLMFYQTFLTKLIILSSILYVLKKENEIQVVCQMPEGHRKNTLGIVLILTMFTLFLGVYNSVRLYTARLNPHQLVIAHRGFNAVENSIQGLQNAAKVHADYVELDVQMTKDGKFVVVHDYDLKRLANIQQRVKERDFQEVKGLPISQGNQKAVIPSLNEFVQKAQVLDMALLIELKPDGQDPQFFVQKFLEEWDSWSNTAAYKVMSLDKDVMQCLKQERPSICSGYVIPIQFGHFEGFHMDFYVIEDFSYNEALVQEAHEDQAELFVWTINEESQMERYAQSDADGIITDYPDQMQNVKKNIQKYDTYLDRVLRLITDTK